MNVFVATLSKFYFQADNNSEDSEDLNNPQEQGFKGTGLLSN